MKQQPPRLAFMLDLLWPYKRHASIFFAGTQQYAKENGWISIIDEFVHNTLPAQTGAAVSYDGIIARIRPHPISANLLRSARPPQPSERSLLRSSRRRADRRTLAKGVEWNCRPLPEGRLLVE